MKDNIVRIYPKEKSKAQLIRDSMVSSARIASSFFAMKYHTWRVNVITREMERTERKHQRIIARLEQKRQG